MLVSLIMKLFYTFLFVVVGAAGTLADDKVGVILPLSGDFGYFGEQVRQGMTLAIEEVQAKGVKSPSLIFEDDKCLAMDAVTAYRKLADRDKVSLIIGPACSTSIQSVAPIARRGTLPILFLLDTGENVSSLPDPLYSFGFDPPKMARMLARDLRERGVRGVASIVEEEEYAVLITRAFETRWTELGGKIVIKESMPINSTDLRSILTRTLSKKPEAIFFSSAYHAGAFLKQLRLLDANVPVYGNDTMCISDTVDAAGGAANGARCGNVVLDEYLPSVKAFRTAIEKRFGKAPSSLFYEAMGYDAVRLMFKELGLQKLPGLPLLGVTERSSKGIYEVEPKVLEIRDGKIVPG